MSTIQELETAVTRLSPEELQRFRAWFEDFDAANWDCQFDRDVEAGKLDRLADQAKNHFNSGRCTEL